MIHGFATTRPRRTTLSGVLTLLVDDDEALVGAVAQLLLQLDHLAHPVVDELPLSLHQLLTLLSRLVEEARVDLTDADGGRVNGGGSLRGSSNSLSIIK